MAATDWPEAKQIKLRDALRNVTLCNCGGGTIYEIILDVLERTLDESVVFTEARHRASDAPNH